VNYYCPELDEIFSHDFLSHNIRNIKSSRVIALDWENSNGRIFSGAIILLTPIPGQPLAQDVSLIIIKDSYV